MYGKLHAIALSFGSQGLYEINLSKRESLNIKEEWDNHPSRIKNQELSKCKFCKRPTPSGEIKRWGKCSFCWRVE